MIMIILSVCLVTAPQQCRDINIPTMVDSASPYMCMTMGQIEASKWVQENPRWALKRMRCGSVRHSAEAR